MCTYTCIHTLYAYICVYKYNFKCQCTCHMCIHTCAHTKIHLNYVYTCQQHISNTLATHQQHMCTHKDSPKLCVYMHVYTHNDSYAMLSTFRCVCTYTHIHTHTYKHEQETSIISRFTFWVQASTGLHTLATHQQHISNTLASHQASTGLHTCMYITLNPKP